MSLLHFLFSWLHVMPYHFNICPTVSNHVRLHVNYLLHDQSLSFRPVPFISRVNPFDFVAWRLVSYHDLSLRFVSLRFMLFVCSMGSPSVRPSILWNPIPFHLTVQHVHSFVRSFGRLYMSLLLCSFIHSLRSIPLQYLSFSSMRRRLRLFVLSFCGRPWHGPHRC